MIKALRGLGEMAAIATLVVLAAASADITGARHLLVPVGTAPGARSGQLLGDTRRRDQQHQHLAQRVSDARRGLTHSEFASGAGASRSLPSIATGRVRVQRLRSTSPAPAM